MNPSPKKRKTAGLFVTINPNGFNGTYYTQDRKSHTKLESVPVVTGLNFVSIYGTGMGFEIYFVVLPSGLIDPGSIKPAGAATAVGAELKFKTVEVVVDPGVFAGGFQMAGFGPMQYRAAAASFYLVRDLWTFIEFYRTGYGQFVRINVAANGTLTTANYNGAVSVVSATATQPARLVVNSRNVVVHGIPGATGEIYAGNFRTAVKLGGTVPLVVNFPLAFLNKNMVLPAAGAPLGESAGGTPLAQVPLLTFS